MSTRGKGEARRKSKRPSAGSAAAARDKGASAVMQRIRSAAARSAADAKPVPVVLRISNAVLARVDRLVRARRAKNPIPRTTWLLEAVNEKLNREEEGEEDEVG